MAFYRIITTIVAILLSLLVVTAWSFPMSSANKYPMENNEGLYSDLFQALNRVGSSVARSSRNRHQKGNYVDGFGAQKHQSINKDIPEFTWLFNAEEHKDDVGKRDYGDLGFFFGKRSSPMEASERKNSQLQRESRDYGDLGMFFGKRSANGAMDERNMEFADFAA